MSPAASNAAESRCSLEFASRAKQVELGAAKKVASIPKSATASPAMIRVHKASTIAVNGHHYRGDTDLSSSSTVSYV